MPWAQLFKRWITLPSGPISTQWIEKSVFLILTHWIMIHPMDSAIQHLNNRGLENKLHKILKKKDRRKMISPLLHCVESKYFWQANSSILIILLNPS